jgi:hypothetical protein
MGLWRSLTNSPARLSRWGVALCLIALVLWLTTIVVRTGQLPAQDLDEAAEFLVAVGAVLYAVDKAAGRVRRGRENRRGAGLRKPPPAA